MKDEWMKIDRLWLHEATGEIREMRKGEKSGLIFHFTEGKKEGIEYVQL